MAILLIVAVLIVVINQSGTSSNEDTASKVYKDEFFVLRTIQLNDTLRGSVLALTDSQIPVEDTNAGFPQDVKQEITKVTPAYLTCSSKICGIDQECLLSSPPSTELYTTQAGIFSDLNTYNPRKMVIFCSI